MQPYKPTLEALFRDICEAYDQDYDHILHTPFSGKNETKCRRLFCYLTRMYFDYQGNKVAKFLDIKHCTVVYHVKKIRDWVRLKDATFSDEWEEYTKRSKLWPFIKDYKQAA